MFKSPSLNSMFLFSNNSIFYLPVSISTLPGMWRKTLADLTSRWMMLLEWTCSIADSICMRHLQINFSGKYLWLLWSPPVICFARPLINCSRFPKLMYSYTRHSCSSSWSKNTSLNWTIFGWQRQANNLDSLRAFSKLLNWPFSYFSGSTSPNRCFDISL